MRWLSVRFFGGLVCASVAASCADVCAQPTQVVEEQFDVPVLVLLESGRQITHPIRVTVFRDSAVTARQPAIVISHGRPGDAVGRRTFGRARYAEISRWFVDQGFIVAIPTRIGYGVTGGDDLEESGTCGLKRFGPGLAAAAEQTAAVVGWLQQRQDVDANRIVALGQSFGGAAVVALTARNPPGLTAAINFAGGAGGDPKNRPGYPCSPEALGRLFHEYGKSGRVPTLWVYAANDHYWGATLPQRWARSYQDAGAPLEFVMLGRTGDEGHQLFARSLDRWRPLVARFLTSRGIAMDASR